MGLSLVLLLWRFHVAVLMLGVAMSACAIRRHEPLPQLQGRGPVLFGLAEDRAVLTPLEGGCLAAPVTARVTLEGTLAGRRLRSVIWIGVNGDLLRIESASGQSFVVTSNGQGEARVTLRRAGQPVTVTAGVRQVVQAAIGLPLIASDLHAVLMACPQQGGEAGTMRTGPGTLDVLAEAQDGHDILHLSRPDDRSPWELLAMTSTRESVPFRWRSELRAPLASVPARLRLTSLDWKGAATTEFDVMGVVDSVQLSTYADFTAGASGPAATITLEALKAGGTRLPLVLD